MKITKTVHHGKPRWRVNDAHGTGGKRQRRFFETKEAAERFAHQRTSDRNAFGIHFATIPPGERAFLAYNLDRLRVLGWTLPQAVDFIERHGKAPPNITLGKLAAEFIASRKAAGIRPRYLRTLRASINRFLINRREKTVSEITPAEIQEYISRNNWAVSTMRSYLVDVRTLFSFAVKRKYLRENPALAVDLPRQDEKPPGIITPDQARALLGACLDWAPDILPVVVLSLFAGIRRAEAEKLEWGEISEGFIEIKAQKAKTRRRRLVAITPHLRAWLRCARDIGGKLPAVNYADKFKRALEKAELRAEWPQNALRHSFASYHYAKNRNENETAAIMGNSPQMVFAHYRELVRPADAEAFFGIMPPPDALARAKAARVALRHRAAPPRTPKITPEALAATFDGGHLALTRQAAVAALCARCGCCVAAAYNALLPTGRFCEWLREADGLLSWQPSPPESGEPSLDCISFPIAPEAEKLLAVR